MAQEEIDDYEPSIAGDEEMQQGSEQLRMPLPGIVSSLLTHGDVE